MKTEDWVLVAEQELARPTACEILGTCASSGGGLLTIAWQLELDEFGPEAMLAMTAWEGCARMMGVSETMGPQTYALICAEAESLLQSGWFPGEHVEGY